MFIAMNIPIDIDNCAGKYILNCRRDFYRKHRSDITPMEFYFRISCARQYNSTVVFLCNQHGEFIYEGDTQELIDMLKSRYRSCTINSDGRIILYEFDDDNEDRALWAMSDHKMYWTTLQLHTENALESICSFCKLSNTFRTVEECRNFFSESVKAVENYKAHSKPYRTLTSKETLIMDAKLLFDTLQNDVQ